MTDIKPKIKIRPSSSGFLRGDTVHTAYSSGCLRYMKANRKSKFVEIDPVYAEVGALHEDLYAISLGDTLDDRELVIKLPLGEDAEYTGRCDFVDTNGAIHETKATISKSSKTDIIDKGIVNLNHLAQLVSYMVVLKRPKGFIYVGYYEKDLKSFIKLADRKFEITIDNDGSIYIDGSYSEFNAFDYLDHVKAQIALDTVPMPNRPYRESKFKSPCALCPLSELCDSVDIGETDASDFVSKAVPIIETTPARPAKPNIYKPKKGKS